MQRVRAHSISKVWRAWNHTLAKVGRSETIFIVELSEPVLLQASRKLELCGQIADRSARRRALRRWLNNSVRAFEKRARTISKGWRLDLKHKYFGVWRQSFSGAVLSQQVFIMEKRNTSKYLQWCLSVWQANVLWMKKFDWILDYNRKNMTRYYFRNLRTKVNHIFLFRFRIDKICPGLF
jgi:hypothetical protein